MRTWTTLNLAAHEQYSYWREVICLAYTVLDPVCRERDSFESTVRATEIGGLTISDTVSKAQTVIRGKHEIRRLMTEDFYVILQLDGRCKVSQHNRESVISAGDFVMVDASEPFDIAFEDFNILTFSIPHQRLLPLLRSAQDAVAVRGSAASSISPLTRSYLQSLKDASEDWPEQVKDVTTSHLLNLLALTFGPAANTESRSSERHALKVAIDRYIDANLANPQLSVAMVAGHFHLSPRSLHRLFELSGQSFTQMILDKRLGRAAAMLKDTARELSVSEVAYRAGFSDLSHFCKTFSRRYGISASQFRRAPYEPLNLPAEPGYTPGIILPPSS
ncbi:AraC-type DNA-binding protein [Solimonas aquatica]|uniref:AraC-type DNA-binding protein n=1 Tax=Solimonas aquatica TaxID=489703 RepID=A0A1H9A474_9GAMM|nr:helix-turn-helix domain-containing protein [Solimonas aquatica]SEP71490.1 AraC-type DNA-binding protein [Solimonas aquatica]